jgi:hypothetical protein
MRDDAYVPNDVSFGSDNNKVMVITGPNMAVSWYSTVQLIVHKLTRALEYHQGKSSYVRAVALILGEYDVGVNK